MKVSEPAERTLESAGKTMGSCIRAVVASDGAGKASKGTETTLKAARSPEKGGGKKHRKSPCCPKRTQAIKKEGNNE